MVNNYYVVKDVFRSELDCYVKDFTSNHLLVYLYMQKYKNIQNVINFSMGWMFDELDINYKPTRSAMIDALFDLADWNLIKLENIDRANINKNTRIRCKLSTYNNNFTKLDMYSIDKILKINIDIRNKKSMLQIYCYLASRIDDKGYCYPSCKTISGDLNITENTINNSLMLLQENDLVVYGNAGYVVTGNKVVKSNNIYTLCCIEDYADILKKATKNREGQLLAENKKVILAKKKNNKPVEDIDKVQNNNTNIEDIPACNSNDKETTNNNNNDINFLEKLVQFRNQNSKVKTVVTKPVKYNF